MFQNSDRFSYKPAEADWSRETRGKQLISCVNMKKWLLLHTPRDAEIANNFMNTLNRVCGPMGMNVDKPTV